MFYNLFSKTYNLWRLISWIVGLRHRVHGTENLITDGPRILVVNHQSALDIPALLYVWPKRSTFVAKQSIATYASFGLLVWLMKGILINRSNRTRGKGMSGLLPFKKGAFHLAVKAQVPIQPIVIGPYTGFDVSKRIAKGCFCDIFVLPPIYTTDLTNDDVASLTDKVHKQMSDMYMSCHSSKF
ncbi:unnamed protein product [Rodentolepis nana]|uniref:1-acylglycerol-3-phosphate O-acyltransferase n=1 Tax=Rodentolepis nana TaxID=102285 RepID=A0A0R3TKA6_RODNA|nr:unnamed protein product [Rodentolepis nana]